MKNLDKLRMKLAIVANTRKPVEITTLDNGKIFADFIVQDCEHPYTFGIYRDGYKIIMLDIKYIGTVSAMIEVFTNTGFDDSERTYALQSKITGGE